MFHENRLEVKYESIENPGRYRFDRNLLAWHGTLVFTDGGTDEAHLCKFSTGIDIPLCPNGPLDPGSVRADERPGQDPDIPGRNAADDQEHF